MHTEQSIVCEMLELCLRQSRTTAEAGSEDLKQTKIVAVQTLSERVGWFSGWAPSL